MLIFIPDYPQFMHRVPRGFLSAYDNVICMIDIEIQRLPTAFSGPNYSNSFFIN